MQNFQRHDNRSAPRETNQMVFGIRAVIEAIDSGKEIESLFVQRGLGGSLFLELKALLKEHEISFQQVPIEKLNRITRKNHQGVIAVISPITYHKVEDLVPAIYEKGETPLFLILDGVTDVRNLGAIARTAECSGVHAIIVPKKGSAEINPDAIKTSAGALYKIPVCRHDVDYSGPTAIIMGAEDVGVSDDLIRIADHLAKIPMFGEIGSLNVSVSAGIVLYEAIRQRTTIK